MARVAAETKVITQMGTQTSAEPRVLRTVELIQSGALGEITEIHMTTDRPIWPQGYDRAATARIPCPSTLDWDLWLGTAATRPFQGHVAGRPSGVSAPRRSGSSRPEGHAVSSVLLARLDGVRQRRASAISRRTA